MPLAVYRVMVDGVPHRAIHNREIGWAVVGRQILAQCEQDEINRIRENGPAIHARYVEILQGTEAPAGIEEKYNARRFGGVSYADYEAEMLAIAHLRYEKLQAEGRFDSRAPLTWHLREHTALKAAKLVDKEFAEDIEVLPVEVDPDVSVLDFQREQMQNMQAQRRAVFDNQAMEEAFGARFASAMGDAVELERSVSSQRRRLLGAVCAYLAHQVDSPLDDDMEVLATVGYDGNRDRWVWEAMQNLLSHVRADAEELGTIEFNNQALNDAVFGHGEPGHWHKP